MPARTTIPTRERTTYSRSFFMGSWFRCLVLVRRAGCRLPVAGRRLKPYSKSRSEGTRRLQRKRAPEVWARDGILVEFLVHVGDVEHVEPQRGVTAGHPETLFEPRVEQHREREAGPAAAIGLDDLRALREISLWDQACECLTVPIVRRERHPHIVRRQVG